MGGRYLARFRNATLLPGKQPARCFVSGDGLLEVSQAHRPSAFAGDIFTDRFHEQAGNILLRLRGECPALVPDSRADDDLISIPCNHGGPLMKPEIPARPVLTAAPAGSLREIIAGVLRDTVSTVMQRYAALATDAPLKRNQDIQIHANNATVDAAVGGSGPSAAT